MCLMGYVLYTCETHAAVFAKLYEDNSKNKQGYFLAMHRAKAGLHRSIKIIWWKHNENNEKKDQQNNQLYWKR